MTIPQTPSPPREMLCFNCLYQSGCREGTEWCLFAIWKRHDDETKRLAKNAQQRAKKRATRNRAIFAGNVAKARAVRSKVTSLGLRKYDRRANKTGVLNLVKRKHEGVAGVGE